MASFNREALWDKGEDETVQVNQRALIDKVLARYSGEFTVFRELLQNSDDAASKRVEIHFQTLDFLNKETNEGGSKTKVPDLNRAMIAKWCFKNDGMAFREEDWNRLKKIAEGNPDEDKIGAFGVGFYSLFSVTEEPFVTSGDQWMGFYWKGDQLVARKGTLDEPNPFNDPSKEATITNPNPSPSSPWTTFDMPLREQATMPKAFDFIQFLCSSLTFMVHLSSVSVYINNTRLAQVTKSSASPKFHELPSGLKKRSDNGIMRISGIESTSLNITALVLGAVYSGGSAKPAKVVAKPADPTVGKQSQRAFFSSLISSILSPSSNPTTSNQTSDDTSSLAPAVPKEKEVDPTEEIKSSILLTVYSAHANVVLEKKLADELHRSTKKNPPKKIVYNLIYTGMDAYNASTQEDRDQALKSGSVFQGLRADLEGAGTARVFIGHATGQTTGLGGHMAARFIPTVERESIDLVDRNVAVWNKELLYVGGYLARAAYEYEMDDVRALWSGSLPSSRALATSIDPGLQAWLQNRCLHAMKFFSFHASTPSDLVSHLLESAFYGCSLVLPAFPVISTHGVLESRDMRLYDETFAKFMKNLPVLPSEIQALATAPKMVAALRSRQLLKPIVLSDVLNELRARPLDESEMVECLKWWFALDTEGFTDLKGELRKQFLDAAVVATSNFEGRGEYRVIPLSTVKTFVSQQNAGSIIPVDDQLPLPSHTFPYSLSRQLPKAQQLQNSFGWMPLDLADWLSNILSLSEASNMDVDRATKILQILARSWGSLDNPTKSKVADLLRYKDIMPTRNGLMRPGESYFAVVDIFPDLPVVNMATKGKAMDQMLEFLGVRKHVDLQLIFSRLYKSGDWSTADLIKYLASIRKNLTPDEMTRLKQTEAFLQEDNGLGSGGLLPNGDIKKDPASSKPQKFIAGKLYEPTDANRDLGLPVLDWGAQQRWRSGSAEANFLFEIGLIKHPSTDVVLKQASNLNSNPEKRAIALNYFLTHFDNLFKATYEPSKFKDLAFVPAVEAGGTQFLGKPFEVFADADAAIFGFSVVHPDFKTHALTTLKLSKDPPSDHIMKLLQQSAPRDPVQANRWFEALSNRLADFSQLQRNTLMNTAFIPKQVNNGKGWYTVMYKPTDCYLSHDNAAKFHSQLFVFVDYSDKASHFLRICGIKDAPTTQEIAQILVNDPKTFLEKSGGREIFLTELRNLAVNHHRISATTLNKISKTACLLGLKRHVPKGKSSAQDGEDDLDDDWQYVHELALPKQIVIVDDTSTYAMFAEVLLAAPQEDLLEDFYASRGSPRLSSLIKQEYHPSGVSKDKAYTSELRSLVLSRLSLFLHEHGNSRTAVDYNWLSKEGNFFVEGARRIELTKHLKFHSISASRSLDASAAAIRAPRKGPITLWVAGEVDMYEVANSLLSIILQSHKVNDALLLSTILSTDLRALRRRGYNVDRILKQQKMQREAEEQALKQERELFNGVTPTPGAYPEDKKEAAPPPPFSGPAADAPNYEAKSPVEATKEKDPQQSGLMGSFKRMIRQPSKQKIQSPPRPASIATPPMMGVSETGVTTRPNMSSTGQGNAGVTSPAAINANVRQALMACKPTNASLLRNRTEMTMVKESLEEGYCDVSGYAKDVHRIGTYRGMAVYLAAGVPDGSTFVTRNGQQLNRFISIILPLSQVYGLSADTIHIFYDMEGGLIAFNRNGSIFLNFRYFLAWHETEVLAGKNTDAFISWYFSLAHEIAHNLVKPHNAEHEFYFSSICENFMVKLCDVLVEKGNGQLTT